MRVYVKPNFFKSDIFEVDDDITEKEANYIACQWICENIAGVLIRADGKKIDWNKK